MGFSHAIKSCFSKYTTWSGRASRSEYWFFQLFFLIVLGGSLFISITSEKFGIGLFAISYMLFLLPQIAVTIRRLHDTNHSGWWYWISVVPLVGAIVLLVFMCSKGDEMSNDYGEPPLAEAYT